MGALDEHEHGCIHGRQQHLEQHARADADDAAAAVADALRQQAARQAQHLRDQQNEHAEPEQRHHQFDVEARPGRKQLEIVIEILEMCIRDR